MSRASNTRHFIHAVALAALAASPLPARAATYGLSCETLSWLDAAVWTDTRLATPKSRRRLHTLFSGIDRDGVAAELSTRLTRGETSSVMAFIEAIDPRISMRHPSLASVQKLSRVLVGGLDCDPEADPRQPAGTALEIFAAAPAGSAFRKLSIVTGVSVPVLRGTFFALAIVAGFAAAIAGTFRMLARRRPSARRICDIAVEIDTDAGRLPAAMTDISLTGCKLVVASPPGRLAAVTFRGPDLVRPARVSWSTISAAGLSFDPPLAPAEVDALLEHCRRQEPEHHGPNTTPGRVAAS